MPRAPHTRPFTPRPASPHAGPGIAALVALAALAATPAQAQGRWGGGGEGGWGGSGPWGGPHTYGDAPRDDSREGRVTVERFPAPDSAPLLGHGGITLAPPPPDDPSAREQSGPDRPAPDQPDHERPANGDPDQRPDSPPPGAPPVPPGPYAGPAASPGYVSPREQAIFEAAVIDALVKAGYNTALPTSTQANAPTSAQVVQLRITHSLLVPAEQRRSPVSGEMAVGASNRGSMLGFGLNIDLTKPRPALISTTLTLRIRDAASGKPLWEGRASIATPEGSSHWPDQAIATRLASALFAGFPTAGNAPTRR